MVKAQLYAAGAALLALLAIGTVAAAKPAEVAPEAAAFHIGRFQAYTLRDAENMMDNDAKTFGVGHTPAEVADVLRRAGTAPDHIELSVDALLVKAPGRVMLFDTGLGPKVHGEMMASLAKAGVSPQAVTDIFITHSHGDHVGGLVDAAGQPAFPHAVIHMSAKEWSWMQSQPRSAELARAISSQVKPFEPGGELAPGVRAVALYGHTPGHVGYQISSGGVQLLDMGDTAHSSIISLARPDWTVEYDTDADQGRRSRRETLTRLARDGEWVFGPHMPFPGVGHVAAAGDGFVWRPGLP